MSPMTRNVDDPDPRREASATPPQRFGRLSLAAAVLAGCFAGIAGIVGIAEAGVARAATTTTIDVTTTVDDGPAAKPALCPGSTCSLRDAILYANANPGTTISVPSGVFMLNGTQLSITAGVTVVGAGAGASGTVIEQQAHSGSRVVSIQAGPADVTISGVEMTQGNYSASVSADGGGVYSAGYSGSTVTLSDDLIDHNSTTGLAGASAGASGGGAAGGGVAVGGFGNLALPGTTVTDNTVTAGAGASTGGFGGVATGGGIDFDSTGALSIGAGSSITGNTVAGGEGAPVPVGPPGIDGYSAGGGVAIIDPTVPTSATISDTTISGNSVNGPAGPNATLGQPNGEGGDAQGGGIYTQLDGTVSIIGSTISGNVATAGAEGSGGNPSFGSADASGAGLFVELASAVVEQTTIAGNLANGTAAGAEGRGGGVSIAGPTAIVDSTLADNTAESNGSSNSLGGAIYVTLPTTLAADTIDGNTSNTGSGIFAEQAVSLSSTVIAGASGSGCQLRKTPAAASPEACRTTAATSRTCSSILRLLACDRRHRRRAGRRSVRSRATAARR